MLRISKHFVSTTTALLILLDGGVLFSSTYASASLRFALTGPLSTPLENLFDSAIVSSLVLIFSMSALGMYQSNLQEGIRATLLRLMPACVLGFALVTLVYYVVPALYLGRGIVAFMLPIAAPAILLTRSLYYKSTKSKLLQRRVLFLGAGAKAKECSDLTKHSWAGHQFQVVGFIEAPGEERRLPANSLLHRSGSLLDIAKTHYVQEIVVAVQDRRGGALPIQELLACKLHGINVIDAAGFFEREACQIRVDSLQPSWLIFGDGFDQGFFRHWCKKTFDLLVSVCVLIVASPLLLLTALCIFLEDRGPVFYRQERVGKNGQTFMVLKFRSMRVDAEKAGAPQWAAAKDPRVTRVGRIIRTLRIDEFPQILNVLAGDMSFVGPRPERPYFVERLAAEIPYYDVRHSIKPGITGMAQVRYQYGSSVEDAVQKMQYDLYYVKNNSLFLDLLILIDTLQVVILGKGSR